MADEARVIFELVDRSGPAAAATTPSQPGSSNVPGANVAAEFQQRISQQGGVGEPGAGSAPAGQAPSAAPLQQPSQAAAYPTSPAPPAQDPLLQATRQVVEADPRTTRAELETAFGIPPERAQQLLDAAQGRQDRVTATSASSASTPPQTPPTTAASSASAPPPTPPSPSPAPSAGDDIPRPPPLPREQRLAESERREPPLPRQPIEPDEIIEPDVSGTRLAIQRAIQGIASFTSGGGPIGAAVARTAAAAAPSIAEAAAPSLATAAPGLAGALSVAGPIGGTVATAAAAAAIPVAATAALLNEEERALQVASRFSPEAQQALAEANVRQIAADIRSAQRLGDEVADFVESRSRLSTSLQGIRDVASEPILRDFNNIIGTLSGAVERLNNIIQENPQAAQSFLGKTPVFTAVAGPILGPLLGDLFAKLNKTLEEKEKLNNPFTWFNAQPHLPPPAPFSTTDAVPKDVVVGTPGLGF